MIAHAVLRLRGPLARNRVDDGCVIVNDLRSFARDRQMEAAQPIDMPALPAHDGPKLRHTRGVVQRLVEFEVDGRETFEVATARQSALLVHKGAQVLPQHRIGLHGEDAGDLALDLPPQEVRLTRAFQVDEADQGCVLRKDVDKAFFLQPQQRIAHRRRADAAAILQLGARQGGPGNQHKPENLLAQNVDDLRRRVAGASRRTGERREPSMLFPNYHSPRVDPLVH